MLLISNNNLLFLCLLGVNHGEEMGYLFYMSEVKQDLTKTDTADYLTAQKMVRMWKSFAKTG